MRGVIADIQRFSVFDGPGIRTTVFLKGCPLRCRWCHNPECLSPRPQLRFYDAKCVRCGACAAVCPSGVHRMEGGVHHLQAAACALCGRCIEACPAGALEIAGRAAEPGAVMAEVLRDEKYYRSSGGGLTLSGGEPMAQPEFALALLQAARDHGLHTAVETSGYAPRRVLDAFMPLTDLWLYDMKCVDSGKHRALTGVDNARIVDNLDGLLAMERPVVLRCPMIPGINDGADDLKGLADFVNARPGLDHVELMAYHHMGAQKYGQLSLSYSLEGLRDMTRERRDAIMDRLREACHARVIWG